MFSARPATSPVMTSWRSSSRNLAAATLFAKDLLEPFVYSDLEPALIDVLSPR